MNSPGQIIKERRKELGLTLQDIADHLGCSKMTISKYERNQIQNLKRDKLIALSSILGISPLEIIDSVEIEQTVTIQGFQVQLNHLLYQTKDLNDTEKNLIKNYVQLICTNKGE